VRFFGIPARETPRCILTQLSAKEKAGPRAALRPAFRRVLELVTGDEVHRQSALVDALQGDGADGSYRILIVVSRSYSLRHRPAAQKVYNTRKEAPPVELYDLQRDPMNSTTWPGRLDLRMCKNSFNTN
jgi:hypothetical protein